MSVTLLIKGTPLWVWALLLFLIFRGISALSDRQMRIERLFLLPMIFLVWAVYSVITETSVPLVALALMFVGLLVGIALGWMLWCSQPRLRSTAEKNIIIRPGTPLTLILIILLFVVKYALTAALSIWPMLYPSLYYNVLFGLLSGILDGIFWGATFNLFIPWYRARPRTHLQS